jgi:CDP-diacylglycerol--glycerol-3-phosphate 3-phosphatidyltransferase
MNLANRLTLLRIILVPVFMVFLLNKITYGEYLAAGVFVIAALTDSLDGYVARKHNQVTKLGKLMDPSCRQAAYYRRPDLVWCRWTNCPRG